MKLDQKNNPTHPLFMLMDYLTMVAAELTNEWYFDMVIWARFDLKSSGIPKETIMTRPEMEEALAEDYKNYVQQMMASARNWSMADFGNNKVYEKDGVAYMGVITENDEIFNIRFVERHGLKGGAGDGMAHFSAEIGR